MSTVTDRPERWLLYGLAGCGICGSMLAAMVTGRDRRFYTCDCFDALRDAHPLEQAVIAAATDHERRHAGGRIRPFTVVDTWHRATPPQIYARLRGVVDHVAVDERGRNLVYTWTTTPPPIPWVADDAPG